MTTVESPYWTSEETAAYLRVALGTLYGWRHHGKGPRSSAIGRRLRYRPADVKAWVKQQEDASATGGGAR